jgi:PAS domain-containing protein
MRDLAVLRHDALRLRERADLSGADALNVVDHAIELADVIRQDAGASHQRCVELEKEIQLHVRQVETLFDLVPVAVVTTDRHGLIQTANRAAATLLAPGPRIAPNQPMLHYAEDREKFAALIGQLPALTDQLVATARLRPFGRAPFDAQITIVPDSRDPQRCLWFIWPASDDRRRVPDRPTPRRRKPPGGAG